MKIGDIGQAFRALGQEISNKFGQFGDLLKGAFSGTSPLKGTHQDRTPTTRVTGSSPLLAGHRAQGSGPTGEATKGKALDGMKPFTGTSAPHYMRGEMPTDPQARQAILRDAQLANFPYTRDESSLPEGFVVATDMAKALREEMGLTGQGVELGDGAIVDPKSGLVATVLVNPTTKEVIVSFGGTTSGKKVGADLMARSQPGKNFMTTLSQWGANFKAGLGGVPKSYQQASDLVGKLQERMKSTPGLEGFSVRTVGHSKGGGEAMYAALRQGEPLRCTAFCPSHLSKGLIDRLPEGNAGKAKDLVQSFSPFGDPVSALRGKLPDVPGVGVGVHFTGIEGRNMIHIHDQFLQHVQHHLAPQPG